MAAVLAPEYDVCPVCAEKRRKVTWVSCSKCSFSCCRGCVKKYLLDQPDINPKCMSCKSQWDFEFVAEHTDSVFHNQDYRNYRAKIIVDREKSLLPATQPYVARELEMDAVKSQVSDIDVEIKELKKQLKEAQMKKRELQIRLVELKGDGGDEEKTVTRFVGHCPQKECKGFLDKHYVCGLCKEKACRSCRLPKHDGDCDKDTVETVKLMAKDTRSCPNCGVPIYRVSGCAQIWCVSCHTPFDWDTGKIETGRIHNPHYYEWQRKNGGIQREAGDRLCGGRVDDYILYRKVPQDIAEWTMLSYRASGHIRAVEIPIYRQNGVNEETNRDLRIKFLKNELDEESWIREIKKREKKREKNRAIELALTMFVDTLDDLHGNIVTCKNRDEVTTYIEQMKELRTYTNGVLSKISKRFENQAPQISKGWKMRTTSLRYLKYI
jgi:hypothetical protein